MSHIITEPIAFVRGGRISVEDDHWGQVTSIIKFEDRFTHDCLIGLDEFSHVEVIYFFNQVDEANIENGARHPRGRQDWPRVGIFAQRGKDRPNRLGLSRARILHIDGLNLHVQGLDAIDGTPVLDVKPVMQEFEAQGAISQPQWATELMRNYY